MSRTVLPDPNVPASQQYRKLECVGRGAYGSVHKGVFIPTGEVVGLKIINLDGQDDDVEAIQKEVALLSSLRGGDSINITRYHGCWLEGPHVWIVMDFAQGGSVRTLAKAAPNNSIEEKFTAVVMREVLQGLVFLHRNSVIHRDLKAANVLISSEGRVMLCDFGVSALLPTPHSKRSTFVGTPQWMAPEVILGQTYDTKADIWGLGITLYEMATGAPPHADQDHMRALMLIPKLKPPTLPAATDASKEMRDFLGHCLQMNPSDRFPAEELAKTKWIKSAKASVSILKDLLTRYESWTSKGGVRTSLASPFGAQDPDDEPQSDSHAQPWEFDTVRAASFAEGIVASSTMDFAALSENPQSGDTGVLNPPRSLRMLFEDASNPGVDPFRVNVSHSGLGMNAASSSSTISTDLSIDDNSGDSTYSTVPTDPNVSIDSTSTGTRHILSPPFDSQPGLGVVRRDSTDIPTARPANYTFPQPGTFIGLDVDIAEPQDLVPRAVETDSLTVTSTTEHKLRKPSFSGSMGLPPSPRPLGPRGALESDANSVAASNNPSASGHRQLGSNDPVSPPRVPSYREVRDSKGLANISIPPVVGTGLGVVQLSGSPEGHDGERPQERTNSQGVADTRAHHGQSSGSESSLPSAISGANTRHARERPPRSKRNVTVGSPTDFRFGGALSSSGLVPPSVGSSHGVSRSLDSRNGTGFGGGNFGGSNVNGGLPPRPPLLGRQTSALAVLEGAGKNGLAVPGRGTPSTSSANGGPVLKDLLKLSPVPSGTLGPGTNPDMLPPSPGTASASSPVSRVFNPSGLHMSTTPTDVGSPVTATNGLRAYLGGHSQSNSYSNTSQVYPRYPEVPDLAPLDLGPLVSTDDVHSELARTVDGLMAWLGVVDAGLGQVLGLPANDMEVGGDGKSEVGARLAAEEEGLVGGT